MLSKDLVPAAEYVRNKVGGPVVHFPGKLKIFRASSVDAILDILARHLSCCRR